MTKVTKIQGVKRKKLPRTKNRFPNSSTELPSNANPTKTPNHPPKKLKTTTALDKLIQSKQSQVDKVKNRDPKEIQDAVNHAKKVQSKIAQASKDDESSDDDDDDEEDEDEDSSSDEGITDLTNNFAEEGDSEESDDSDDGSNDDDEDENDSSDEAMEQEDASPTKMNGQTPKKEEKTPKKEKKTPLKDERTPLKDEKTPNKKKKTPGKENTTPGKGDKTPGKGDKTPGKGDKTPGKDEKTPGKTPKKVLKGGVQMEELKVGGGPEAKRGKFVGMYYDGRLKSNNKRFDSTLSGKPFKFRLGGGEVIKGWDVGLEGIKVGGKRRLTLPPNMAYGPKGAPPNIPPNSTLVFDVECKFVG